MGKNELGFYWKAILADGSELVQFDAEGKETLYKEVEDNMDNAIAFSVISADESDVYTVDFDNFKIYGPNDIEYVLKGSEAELIYKRRNSVRIEYSTGKQLGNRVTHILGLKTDKEEQLIEIFSGQGQRPKKVEHKKKTAKAKTHTATEITQDVE